MESPLRYEFFDDMDEKEEIEKNLWYSWGEGNGRKEYNNARKVQQVTTSVKTNTQACENTKMLEYSAML